jgi:hypothetical protein
MPKAQPTLSSNLSLLSDADLRRATDRAYREAVRCWAEYRRQPSGDVGRMLLTGAEAADDWWQTLVAEQDARLASATHYGRVETSSSDRYTVGESPQPPTSVWVKRAQQGTLPAKVLR